MYFLTYLLITSLGDRQSEENEHQQYKVTYLKKIQNERAKNRTFYCQYRLYCTTAIFEPCGWRLSNNKVVNLRVPENNKHW